MVAQAVELGGDRPALRQAPDVDEAPAGHQEDVGPVIGRGIVRGEPEQVGPFFGGALGTFRFGVQRVVPVARFGGPEQAGKARAQVAGKDVLVPDFSQRFVPGRLRFKVQPADGVRGDQGNPGVGQEPAQGLVFKLHSVSLRL